MLRFIDISVTVEGLHRAGQDDWDSHAARFNNRIIRSSTRLASFGYEMSEWYQDKIIPTDAALDLLGIEAPEVTLGEVDFSEETMKKEQKLYQRSARKNEQIFHLKPDWRGIHQPFK